MHVFFVSCVSVALLLAAASAEHHHDHHHDHQHDHQHDHDHAGEQMSCQKLSIPNADFGFALYKNLMTKTPAGKNIFYSPLGISTALSMLSTGARGETLKQLFSTLGYSDHDQMVINEAYEHLFHMLTHNQKNALEIGNAMALRHGFNPLEKFQKDIKHFYSSETFSVDFSSNDAVEKINSYIATKTNNKIKEQVKDLAADMAMVLINYVYFNGEWERPFDANMTQKAMFSVDKDTQVEVDMMKRTGRFDYYDDVDNHTSVILLPYKGNASMMIVLPDEGKMAEVEGYINRNYIKHWHDSLYRHSVDLYMPKFTISSEAALDENLKEMGVTSAFGDTADFSGISEEVKLKVSKASHKAVLSVDETGTEAAATTVLEIMPMSMPQTMKLDRPFLVFILEHSTRSIMFMGKIANPKAM